MCNDKFKILANKIFYLLNRGLNINKGTLDFIKTTFPENVSLEKILNSEYFSEKESLIELLLFPEESVQISLEDFLELHDFQSGDEEKLIRVISDRDKNIPIKFLINNKVIEHIFPEDIFVKFIINLKISKKLDKRVIDSINKNIEDEYNALKIKVVFRNSDIIWSENKIEFILDFFKNIDKTSAEFFNWFEFMIEHFEEIKTDEKIIPSLFTKKKRYLRNLQLASQMDSQVSNINFEILHLQGVRIPYINKNELLKKLSIIDAIINSIDDGITYFNK
ncbi:MAG: hypothetical protein HQK76_08560 [Desulfobacterales bacterium]|nr:hypothetical protein [Desulfobacterales bacterium]